MFQMVQFLVPSGPKRPSNISLSPPTGQNRTQTASNEFLQHVRRVSGLKQQDVFYNLRVPNQSQSDRDEINLLLLTGHGVFCIDLKACSGSVPAPSGTRWPLQVRAERSPTLFRHHNVEPSLRSLREGYASWLSDAFTPSWISGHLSYGQMRAVREWLELLGTWDVLQMSSGQELSGDFQGCQHLALNRQETELLEFSRTGSVITDTRHRSQSPCLSGERRGSWVNR